MDSGWTVEARCRHGVRHTVALDWQGRLDVPYPCCRTEEPRERRPSRLRVWWEARRFRRTLRRLK